MTSICSTRTRFLLEEAGTGGPVLASARISSSSALLALPRAWKCRPACMADRAWRRAFFSLESGMAEELSHSLWVYSASSFYF